MRFEWDEDKASANVRKHGVAFEQAIKVFEDPHARSADRRMKRLYEKKRR
jgi:hypothetical protein